MKVLTAAQMREVDRRTIEMGIPSLVLMENAGNRVVDLLAEKFAPLAAQRIVILCGKGNNGGDGMVVARQIFTRFRPRALHVILLAAPEDLKGDAAQNYRMLQVCGCAVAREIPEEARLATLVVDALLGTGISGPASGSMLDAIREIDRGFPLAKLVAVDIPSGMPSDTGEPLGEHARADYTVTFTAPKPAHALAPNCDAVGELHVVAIGSPPELYDADDAIWLSLVQPAMFGHLLEPRPRAGHKGSFGHVLAIAGSHGKTGAAAMCGMAALRRGLGHGGLRGIRDPGHRRPRRGTDDRSAPERPRVRRRREDCREKRRDRHRAGAGRQSRNSRDGAARIRRIRAAHGGGCRCVECAGRDSVVGRRQIPRADAASRRNGPARWQDYRGNLGRPPGRRARVGHGAAGHRSAEG